MHALVQIALIGSALDNYTDQPPSLQNALDIFKDEWSSAVPGSTSSGKAPLFSDPRVTYWLQQAREFYRARELKYTPTALELGPLEGAHTFMLEKDGWDVTSIESNSRAYLKTLIVYNHFKLRASALFGDFVPYLSSQDAPFFDFILASGVLYHMKNPLRVLDLIASKTNAIGVWTHFVTDDFMAKSPGRWIEEELLVEGGFCRAYKQFYGSGLSSNAFCGGGQDYAFWLRKDDLIGRLSHNGFSVDVNSVDLAHPNGPCITFFASRS